MGDFFPPQAGHEAPAPFDPGTPVRVLSIHTATLAPLGADTWIHAQILAHLDASSHELHAACATGVPGDPTPTYEALHGIGNVTIRPVRFGIEHAPDAAPTTLARRWRTAKGLPVAILDFVGLARYIRRHRIQIIHTSDRPRDAAAAVVLGRLTGAKSIVQAHVAYGEWMSPLLKWSLRHADVRIAISSFVAQTLDMAGLDLCRTYIVRNGIDPERWTPLDSTTPTRRDLGVPDGAPVILTACRLFPSKGPAELVRALAAIADRHPDAHLLIVGKELVPGYADTLAKLASEMGVAERVKILGHRTDMQRLMAAADVFAMPSVGEPFGLVYAEAMAMERPVVALDSGGTPEVVRHGTTGLLSPPGDLTALADNLARLLSDPDRCRRLGVNGRRRVEAEFTADRMARDVASVYQAVLSHQTIPTLAHPFDVGARAPHAAQEIGANAITIS
jgi:glycosyltransferase involved in cell wall biosynthesis